MNDIFLWFFVIKLIKKAATIPYLIISCVFNKAMSVQIY